jgi:hypothetical protein
VSLSDSRLKWGLVAMVMAALAALAFALQPRPFYQDAGVFIVIGRGYLSGLGPFKDLFDNKPPGIYLVGAMAWLLDKGDSTLSMQALSVAAVSITATACGWLVSAVFSRFWAGVATAGCVVGGLTLPVISTGGGTTELFCGPGLAVSFACIVAMLLQRKGLRWPAAAGAAFAWAFGCSLLTVAALPALALLWLTIPVDGAPYALERSNWSTWMRRRAFDRRLAAALAGAAAMSLVIWLPVIVTGSVPAALDGLIRYNAVYQASAVFTPSDWVLAIKTMYPLWLPIVGVCLVPTRHWLPLGFRMLAHSNLMRAAVLWAVVALALQLFGRRMFFHYMLLLVPPLGLVLGCVLASLRLERPLISPRLVALALCVAVVGGLGWRWRLPVISSSVAQNVQLADYVNANSSPADAVFAWGYDPALYLEADRSPEGPYMSLVPFVVPGYGEGAVATALERWQAHPPRLIVSGSSGSDLLALWALDYPDPALAPLEAFVHSHYKVVASRPGGMVWQYSG